MIAGCTILKLLKLFRKAFVAVSLLHITITEVRLNKATINPDYNIEY